MSTADTGPAPVGSDLRPVWALLEPPTATELSSYPVRSSGIEGKAPCRVALDRHGLRHLLVPITGHGPMAPEGRGSVLTCTVRSLRFGRTTTAHVDICCTETGLNPEFDDVIADLLDTIDDATDAGEQALAGLQRWRRLFRHHLLRGMTPAARVGLFAELSVLAALLDQRPDLPMTGWTGPTGAAHDIEAPRSCLEVKATGAQPDSITVHGLDQLDTHDDRPLELLVLSVTPDPEGTTLAELVDRVRTRSTDPTGFDVRVQQAGWRDDMRLGDTDPMSLIGLLRIPINDHVPRLVAADLATGEAPPHVRDVTYRLDHDSLVPHASPGSLRDVALKALG